jgi:hypothetical protein
VNLIRKSLFKLKGAWIPLVILCLGLNWSGAQMTVWTALAIDNARITSFTVAFNHAFKGEKVVYFDKDSCACVTCRLVNWQHHKGNQMPDELYTSKNYSIEGVTAKLYRHISPGYSASFCLSDFNHRLTSMNSPPQSPPPQSFV